MTDANAVISPVTLINEAVGQMAIVVQSSMDQITESFSQTTAIAQTNFEILFGTANACITTFSEQFLSLAALANP